MPLPWLIVVAGAAAGGLWLTRRPRIEEHTPPDPGDPATWREALASARAIEAWGQAAEAHQRLAALSQGDDRVAHLLGAARLYEDRLGDGESAISCYEDVLSERPHDAEASAGLKFLRG